MNDSEEKSKKILNYQFDQSAQTSNKNDDEYQKIITPKKPIISIGISKIDTADSYENFDTTYQTNSMRSHWRWTMLVLLSLTICGPHYTYDNPSVLQSQIQKEYKLDSTYYSYLYSIYAAPNIFLPFFGGILIQRWGKGNVIILTTFLTLVG